MRRYDPIVRDSVKQLAVPMCQRSLPDNPPYLLQESPTQQDDNSPLPDFEQQQTPDIGHQYEANQDEVDSPTSDLQMDNSTPVHATTPPSMSPPTNPKSLTELDRPLPPSSVAGSPPVHRSGQILKTSSRYNPTVWDLETENVEIHSRGGGFN